MNKLMVMFIDYFDNVVWGLILPKMIMFSILTFLMVLFFMDKFTKREKIFMVIGLGVLDAVYLFFMFTKNLKYVIYINTI